MRIVTANQLEVILLEVGVALGDLPDAADGVREAVVGVLGLAHLVGVVHHAAHVAGSTGRILVAVIRIELADEVRLRPMLGEGDWLTGCRRLLGRL